MPDRDRDRTSKAGRRGEYTGPICGGKTRGTRKGGECQQPAGWGTTHPGYGRCKLHGGSTQTQTVKALGEMARDEVLRATGVPVFVRKVDREVIRAVALAVVNALDLSVDQQVLAREVLASEIAGLQTVSLARAKRIEQHERARHRRKDEDDHSALAPSAEEDAALQRVERPHLIRRKKRTHNTQEDR
ncbi:MAG TPA: hypothetical protein VK506_09945 [Conexibacter sp.]|nr:hypothetical protein [Conexibacter sp.]